MDDCEARTSAVTDDFDVFLNHRGPDVKATFGTDLDDALRSAGFRPFLDARSLKKGDPALKSIDQALQVAKVHVAIVSKGYAESKYCLKELVDMMKSGKPVIPVLYDVEAGDLRGLEVGPFAKAFQKHMLKGRDEEVREWVAALGALAGMNGFRLGDYKGDEEKLKWEVVNEVARVTPSNQPVDVEHCRVGLEIPTNKCIQVLENSGAGKGMLGLIGVGGVGKTTLAREIYNHFAAQKTFKNMTFLNICRPSTSNVQVRLKWAKKLRKQLIWDLLHMQSNNANFTSCFCKLSTHGPVFIVIDNIQDAQEFNELIPDISSLGQGSRIVFTSCDCNVLNSVRRRASSFELNFFQVSTLGIHDSYKLFNLHAFRDEEAPLDFEDLARAIVEACGGLPLALKGIGSSLFDKRSDEDRETIWPEAIDLGEAAYHTSNNEGTNKTSLLNLGGKRKQKFDLENFAKMAKVYYDFQRSWNIDTNID